MDWGGCREYDSFGFCGYVIGFCVCVVEGMRGIVLFCAFVVHIYVTFDISFFFFPRGGVTGRPELIPP